MVVLAQSTEFPAGLSKEKIMAATNFTPIQLYHSTTASAVPLAANLAQGELAINIADGKLYYEDDGGVVQVIATKGAGTIGGSTTQIQYNNAGALAGNAAMTFNSGTSTTTLTTLNLTNALGAIYGGTAQSAYTQGDVLYASATNTLSKLGIGTVNYILTSTGSVPQWVAPSSVTVNTANNLAGGLAGSVPYQSALDTTTFLAIGAANRVMTSTGSAPQWVTSLTGLSGVSSSSITNTSLTSGRVVISSTAGLESDSANLTFNGTTLSTTGLSNTGFSTLVKTLTLGDSSFNGAAVFAPATPAKLYLGTGTVTDVTSAVSATNATGAITSLAITPIAATNASVTYTNASTLYIAGAPSAGTNITITNPYALYVAAGNAFFGGTVTAGTVNLTTLDLTNLEVTNIKAKDGTAAMQIADTTGVVSVTAAPVLTALTASSAVATNASKALVSVTNTGTGNNVLATSPILVTPDLGAATATSLVSSGTAASSFTVTSGSAVPLTITNVGTGNSFVVEDTTNPDSSPFVIGAGGQVVIGHTAQLAGAQFTPNVEVFGADVSASSMGQFQYSADSNASTFQLNKTRGTAPGTQTIVVANDNLGTIQFSGSDGTGYIRGATILAAVDGTPGTNDMPGRLVFSTTADGGNSPTERMRIDSAGNVGIGDTPTTGYAFKVGKNATGATTAGSIFSTSTIQSGVTSAYYAFRTYVATQATAFTLLNLSHYASLGGSAGDIGAGSTVTNQFGFNVTSSLTGATNNYGFYSDIAATANRYNFYANGTADNFFAGSVGIGSTANASAILDAQSTTKGVRMPNMTTTQKNAIASPAAGLIVFDTTLAKLAVYSGTAWQTITSV
jgi:hypothetical protein